MTNPAHHTNQPPGGSLSHFGADSSWKLEPQTPEERRECETIEGMRARLNRYARENYLVHAVFDASRYRGLSGDDTMTWLAL